MNRYATAALIGVAVEAALWAGVGLAAWKGVTMMDLTQETKIGGYYYPLRAMLAVAVLGAIVAVGAVVAVCSTLA
jgi:hypothetical protein